MAPQMATMRHRVVKIIKKIHICQWNSDFYETLKLGSWANTIYPNLSGLPPNGYYKTRGSPNYKKNYISAKSTRPLWNFKLMFLGYQFGNPSQSQSKAKLRAWSSSLDFLSLYLSLDSKVRCLFSHSWKLPKTSIKAQLKWSKDVRQDK